MENIVVARANVVDITNEAFSVDALKLNTGKTVRIKIGNPVVGRAIGEGILEFDEETNSLLLTKVQFFQTIDETGKYPAIEGILDECEEKDGIKVITKVRITAVSLNKNQNQDSSIPPIK